jgi:hypothetical protein
VFPADKAHPASETGDRAALYRLLTARDTRRRAGPRVKGCGSLSGVAWRGVEAGGRLVSLPSCDSRNGVLRGFSQYRRETAEAVA